MDDAESIHRFEPAGHGSPAHRWRVRHVAETGSTNTDLLDAIERGEHVDGLVVRADHQTAGRGRLDRRWSAPPGTNLLASICFTEVADEPVRLTQAVGVAAVDALFRLGAASDSGLALKWPNDVLVGDAKLAGVLAQRAPSGPVVVGIGLNVGWAPDGAASVGRDLGVDVAPADLLEQVLASLDRLLVLPRSEQRVRYVELLATIGRRVHIELPGGGGIDGVARGIDGIGRLVVVDEAGAERVVDVGDIVHARTPAIDGE